MGARSSVDPAVAVAMLVAPSNSDRTHQGSIGSKMLDKDDSPILDTSAVSVTGDQTNVVRMVDLEAPGNTAGGDLPVLAKATASESIRTSRTRARVDMIEADGAVRRRKHGIVGGWCFPTRRSLTILVAPAAAEPGCWSSPLARMLLSKGNPAVEAESAAI